MLIQRLRVDVFGNATRVGPPAAIKHPLMLPPSSLVLFQLPRHFLLRAPGSKEPYGRRCNPLTHACIRLIQSFDMRLFLP